MLNATATLDKATATVGRKKVLHQRQREGALDCSMQLQPYIKNQKKVKRNIDKLVSSTSTEMQTVKHGLTALREERFNI